MKKWGNKKDQLCVMYTWIGINRLKSQCRNNENEWKLVVSKSEDYLENESTFRGKYSDIDWKLFKLDDEGIQSIYIKYNNQLNNKFIKK